MTRQMDEGTISSAPRVMRTPRNVEIAITSRCNLHCRYCYFFDNPEMEYADLPTGEWLRFFDELGRCAVINVTLAGGEPFVREDLPALIEGIVRNRMRFSLLSNGMLIDGEIAAFIARTGRCDYVQVSLDGSEPASHDAARGKGSFVGAFRGLQVLQRHRVPATVRVTIHRYNVHDLERMASLLLDDLGLSTFSTNSAGYLGSCSQHADELLLTTEQRQEAMDTLSRLAEKYNGRITAAAGPLAEARHWRRMEEARAQHLPPTPEGGRLTGCGCTSSKIAVNADGTIVPCTMLSHMRLGRINQDSLVDIWRNSPELNALRQRRAIPLAAFDFCADCPYTSYCSGNCPGLAYSLTGQVDHPSPDACLRRFLIDGGRIS